MALYMLNPKSDRINQLNALEANLAAAKGLMNTLKSNLGPNGTLKMLVSGSGDIKLTKDGSVLLNQMQIQHPTANLIARTASAQDNISGDGTTSIVLFVGELFKQSVRYIQEYGVHASVLIEGIEFARKNALNFLDSFKTSFTEIDRNIIFNIARTCLSTKLRHSEDDLSDYIARIVTDAMFIISKGKIESKSIDLFMIEIMHIENRSAKDTELIRGLVLDHGTRHPAMSKYNKNCYILTCNLSLEYEKTEINSGFFFSNAEQREKMLKSERAPVNKKLDAIISLKNQVFDKHKNENVSFLIVNQKGIDPPSLDVLQKNGIVALRRAKRRNMERLTLACGGFPVNSIEGLSLACLGHADLVKEYVFHDEKYTFIEGVQNPTSCTILIRGPNKHTIAQIKEAIRDGQRAVKGALEDKAFVRGAGAFEAACSQFLVEKVKKEIKGRAKLGLQAFADALLIIPKTLAENSGLDAQETVMNLMEAIGEGQKVGMDLNDGSVLVPEDFGILDGYRTKRQIYHLGTVMTEKLLLVDEIMRAGKASSQA